jgi:hypothetical protein
MPFRSIFWKRENARIEKECVFVGV